MKSFIKKYDPYISVQNANFLKNKLKKKIQDVFQKNNIQISEEKTNNIFGLIQLNNITNFKGKNINLEKEFSETLLNIGVSNGDNNKKNNSKKKNTDNKYFGINSKKNKNKINKGVTLDDYFLNKKDKDVSSNIEDTNEILNNLDYQEIKGNNINLPIEPKKSKHYLIKQFSFDDFTSLKKSLNKS